VIEHEGRLLGDVRLNANALGRLAGRAELGISLYDLAKLGRGHGREAIRLVSELAFNCIE
jgi:RimJ/RimL family protein N-acetyltransferase